MGSVCALLLTQPASPAVRDCGSASRTGLQELPEAVAGLSKMLRRNALRSECVQDSAEPCLLYGLSPSRRRAVTPMGSTSLGACLYEARHN